MSHNSSENKFFKKILDNAISFLENEMKNDEFSKTIQDRLVIPLFYSLIVQIKPFIYFTLSIFMFFMIFSILSLSLILYKQFLSSSLSLS